MMLVLIALLVCGLGAEKWRLRNVVSQRHLAARCEEKEGLGTCRCQCGQSEDTEWEAVSAGAYNEHTLYRLRSHTNALCVDNSFHEDDRFKPSDGDSVLKAYLHVCNQGSYQKWLLIPLAQDRVLLQSLVTRHYLSESYWRPGVVYTRAVQPKTYSEWHLENVTDDDESE